jgi:phytoene desaturase
MSILFLHVLLAQLSRGELATVEGGSLAFALGVSNRYRNLGGQVTYGAAVEKILVEEDRAVGVRLADSSEHRADVVVSAADGHATIFDMLGGRYVDDAIRKRYNTWSLFEPLIVVSFGVMQTYPDQPHDSRIHLSRPLLIAGQEVDGLLCRVFNRDPTLSPEGKTVVQALLTADFDYWDGLQREDRAQYEAEKGDVAQQVLARLDGHLPGLSDQVEMVDVAISHIFWRYMRNHRGAYEGWLMTAETKLRPLPKTLPGLKGFYMAGQWVEPGGGVPPALYSGRQVVQILCHQDGVPFMTAGP